MVQLLIPFCSIYGTIDNRGGTGLESSVISGDTPSCVGSDQNFNDIILCDRESRYESEVAAAVVCFLPLFYLLQAKTSSKSLGQNACSWRLQCLLDP